MKILIGSHLFAPSIGGLERVGEILAAEFQRAGHSVRVITQTPSGGEASFPYAVLRRPNWLSQWRSVAWCDVFLQNNISLRTAWPLLLCRRPWVVGHHIWITRPDGTLAWQDRLKRFCFRFATHIAVSQAIADALPVPAVVIPNPYADDLFLCLPEVVRNRNLIFVGRLVSDKGVDLLIDALELLRQSRLFPQLTIVGDGPEAPELRRRVAAADLDQQVTFAGSVQGPPLVKLLNQHQIMVVPSRWAEPFGLVALEGIACGCVVVGSAAGGLQEAIGPCGITFPNGDVTALGRVLSGLLGDPSQLENYRSLGAAHLQGHRKVAVAERYLTTLAAAAGINITGPAEPGRSAELRKRGERQ